MYHCPRKLKMSGFPWQRYIGLALIYDIHMSQLVPISAQNGIDVTLHDALEVFSIGDVLHPRGQLRVPNEVMTSNN